MNRLQVGEQFVTGTVEVTEAMRADLVRIGGYTHALFARPDEVSLPEGSPLPGHAVLLLMGGLVEQSERLNDAIVLMGLTDVRFRRPAVPGTTLAVVVEVTQESPHRSGNVVRIMKWSAVAADSHAEVLVATTVQMLVRPADVA